MPDPLISAALAEAYALAPVDQIVYFTLEIWHEDFTVPIRVVRDYDPLDARLEATAPRDAGDVVTFTAYAFDFVPPEQTSDGVPEAIIEIDNVSAEIQAQLDLAAQSASPVSIIFRVYLSDALDDGPENDPPPVLEVSSISCTPLRVRSTAGFPNLLDKRFPGRDYAIDEWPGLQP